MLLLGGNRPVPLQYGVCMFWANVDYPLGFKSALPADATALSSWANLSGNVMTCTQGTGASQPLFKRNVSAGRGGILFDGINDAFNLATTSGTNAQTLLMPSNPYTIIVSFKALVVDATARNLLSTRQTTSSTKTTIGTTGSNSIGGGINNGSAINKTGSFTDTTKPHIITMTNDGSGTIVVTLDGVTLSGTDTMQTSGSTSVVVGSSNVGGVFTTNPWNGYIFDLLIYTGSVLGSTPLTAISKYISNIEGVAL